MDDVITKKNTLERFKFHGMFDHFTWYNDGMSWICGSRKRLKARLDNVVNDMYGR